MNGLLLSWWIALINTPHTEKNIWACEAWRYRDASFYTFCCLKSMWCDVEIYLKSLYGWIIQNPADLTRSCSRSTAFSLPNILRENLLTPGCSIAPNCLCMNPAWYNLSSSGRIWSMPSNFMNPDCWSGESFWLPPPPLAPCAPWSVGPSPMAPGGLSSLGVTSPSVMRRLSSAESESCTCRLVMDERLPRNLRQSPFELVFIGLPISVSMMTDSPLLVSPMPLQLPPEVGDGDGSGFILILFLRVSLSASSPSLIIDAFCPMCCGKL